MRRAAFRRLVLAALLCWLVSGCSEAVDVVRWTEEVRSHDGSTFLLEARATRGRAPIVRFEHRGPVVSIEYFHPPSGAYWNAPGSGFMPSGFDLIEGVPYVVVPVGSEIACIWFDFPDKDLLVFRWNGAGWARAGYADLPAGFDFNLLAGKFHERDPKRDVSGFVTLEMKRSLDGERGGGIKGFLERRGGGTWCAGHKARYERLGIKPFEAFQTDKSPPRLEGRHGIPDADLTRVKQKK